MHVCFRCGLCRPPREPFLQCPQCGSLNDPERGEFGNCKQCGAVLPPRNLPEPAFCMRVGKPCANPCKQADREPQDASRGCIYHTSTEN
ncbi:MAG: hypothetical protein LBC35_03250 [Coriobacteriales bacterium]|nr:hypothetical protein [Coriobacteriales bacterium]